MNISQCIARFVDQREETVLRGTLGILSTAAPLARESMPLSNGFQKASSKIWQTRQLLKEKVANQAISRRDWLLSRKSCRRWRMIGMEREMKWTQKSTRCSLLSIKVSKDEISNMSGSNLRKDWYFHMVSVDLKTNNFVTSAVFRKGASIFNPHMGLEGVLN